MPAPSKDPLLQPYQLKHLTLKNRIMSTSHEPNYAAGGMPTERYRLYHAEKAKGGIAMTMTAGSAIVAHDSPPAFGNLHLYKDEIVPWLKELADSCHEHDCAVMMQLTHLGRRTNWNKGDWLPVLAASPVREPAHRTFPKEAEDWDLERIITAYADSAERLREGGMDGLEFEAYGHFMDGFWSPITNKRTDEWGGSLDNRLRFTFRVLAAVRELHAAGKPTAAICAAPMVLAKAGVVQGVAVTSHPSVRGKLGGALERPAERVVRSGNVITSQGPGTAIEFALALVAELVGPGKAKELAAGMVVQAPSI